MPRIPSSFRNILIDRVIREINPGAEDAIFPRTLEDSAIFIYPGRPSGMEWRSGQMIAASFAGAAGANIVLDGLVATTGLRYYHAASCSHNDVAARNLVIEIIDNVSAQTTVLLSVTSVAQDVAIAVPRSFVLGEGTRLRARASAIAGGFVLTLRTYSAGQGLGSEMPGL